MLVTIKAAAEQLKDQGVTEGKIRHWVRENKVASYKAELGRDIRVDLVELTAKTMLKPAEEVEPC